MRPLLFVAHYVNHVNHQFDEGSIFPRWTSIRRLESRSPVHLPEDRVGDIYGINKQVV